MSHEKASHKGESKISAANDFLGEFHMATKKQFIIMKRMIRLTPFFLIVILLFSCSKDEDYSLNKFWVSAATISTYEVKPYLIITDNGDRLFPTSSNVKYFKPIDKQRVWVSYTILKDEKDAGAEFDYYVKVNDVREILTKGIVTLTDSNKDSIGNDPVEIENVWFSGDFLTIGFVYGGGGAIHFVNLVRNVEDAYTEEQLPILEFRHNRNHDRFNNAMRGWVSFDLSELKVSNQDSVTFILRANSFNEEERFERQLTFKYGESEN